jgi:cobalamin synthase
VTSRTGTAGLLSLALFTLGMVAALASVDRGARVAGCLAMVAGLAGLVTVGLLWGASPSRLGDRTRFMTTGDGTPSPARGKGRKGAR